MCGAGGENSPDSEAVQQLLHVVEGLEEELFSSEARRNDAEVCIPTSCMRFCSLLLRGFSQDIPCTIRANFPFRPPCLQVHVVSLHVPCSCSTWHACTYAMYAYARLEHTCVHCLTLANDNAGASRRS